ncbi:MAG TPA: EAL domain-containing protein [Gallionella sp.]|nr:EAL domain-containing protein [Gallionella sp.]
MERVPTRLFTFDFKVEAVKLITALHLTYIEAGRRLDIPPESISLWHQQFLGGTLKGDPGSVELSPELQRIRQLERELSIAKLERDTLKNTVVNYFTGQNVDADGKRILTGLGVDIAEYQRLQRETQALLQRNQSLMKTAIDGIHILDIQGGLVEFNDAFCQMLGYTREEVAHLNVTDWDVQFSGDELRERLRDFLANNRSDTFETVHRRKDGTLINVEVSCSAMEMGGQTCLLALSRDISKRKQAESEIHSLAFYDALTHLPNRRLLIDRLRHAMASSTRNEQYGAILFLDLDNFKSLNDTRGHDIGDLLLIEAAQRLQGCVREGDTVARFGGDEFVLILEGLSAKQDEAATQAEMIGEKVRAALNQSYHLKGMEHHSSTSIGINLFFNHLGTVDELFKQADVAMYQAKQAGRNAIRFFDPAMQAVLEARSKLEEALRGAISSRQLFLHYQVQVDAALQPIGAEALLRWEHPELGMIPTMKFIELAEETGLILPIGLWVLETACAQIRRWQNDPVLSKLNISVNVSARQFRHEDFVAQVETVLDESGIDPRRLKLELTESLILNNVEDSISKMEQLKSIGVEFSMDDFGTGYSSLSYLKRLPLDQIKIDQSFVRDISTDPSDAAIVKTIIAMAETLGLMVIAEGVESEAQREFLELRGCPAFQGHLFGAAVPVEQFEAMLENWEEGREVML